MSRLGGGILDVNLKRRKTTFQFNLAQLGTSGSNKLVRYVTIFANQACALEQTAIETANKEGG